MIIYAVEHVMLLADKIVLTTSRPEAEIAEIVENTLPNDRRPARMRKHENSYALGSHLLDFLVTRSKTFASEIADRPDDPRRPPPASPRPHVTPSNLAFRRFAP